MKCLITSNLLINRWPLQTTVNPELFPSKIQALDMQPSHICIVYPSVSGTDSSSLEHPQQSQRLLALTSTQHPKDTLVFIWRWHHVFRHQILFPIILSQNRSCARLQLTLALFSEEWLMPEKDRLKKSSICITSWTGISLKSPLHQDK